jgi:hypothetical protein
MPTFTHKTPVEQARMSLAEREQYVAARGGKCIALNNQCPNDVNDSGFLCGPCQMQFMGWNYHLPDHDRQWEFYF